MPKGCKIVNDYEKEEGKKMALNKKPVTGMKDILPAEMQIRDYVMNVIKENYRKFGFTPIETPCVETACVFYMRFRLNIFFPRLDMSVNFMLCILPGLSDRTCYNGSLFVFQKPVPSV